MAETKKKEYKLDEKSVALVTMDAAFDGKGFQRRTKPPFIRPLSLPPNAVVIGKIKALNEHEVKRGKKIVTAKSLLLETQAGDCSFPCSSVIEAALDDEPEKFVGCTIAIKVLPPRKSSTFKKEYFNCEVFIKEK